jgi:hypothetical protein
MSDAQTIDGRAEQRAWASPDARKRVRRRYAADRRLQAYGIIAIGLAVGLLGILITSLVTTGLPAFLQTKVNLEVYVDPSRSTPPIPPKAISATSSAMRCLHRSRRSRRTSRRPTLARS